MIDLLLCHGPRGTVKRNGSESVIKYILENRLFYQMQYTN